jgi:replicative DNA helicase
VSGSIEQDADLVLMLYRNKSNTSSSTTGEVLQLTELIIAKQRNGPIGTVKLKFNEKQTKFLNFE